MNAENPRSFKPLIAFRQRAEADFWFQRQVDLFSPLMQFRQGRNFRGEGLADHQTYGVAGSPLIAGWDQQPPNLSAEAISRSGGVKFRPLAEFDEWLKERNWRHR